MPDIPLDPIKSSATPSTLTSLPEATVKPSLPWVSSEMIYAASVLNSIVSDKLELPRTTYAAPLSLSVSSPIIRSEIASPLTSYPPDSA